ncbi:MAG: ORF6N domain-containing protein, partial [Sulfuricurvum sp.]|nr:ORF6N domain-containing protein [Sulfuricurvum sp.]
VLKSQKAIGVTLAIMRTFTKIRRYAISHNELVGQIQELRQELVQSKAWTKDRLSAVADTIIILEESLSELQEVVLDIKGAEEVEKIGFLRDKNKI